jgi:hypothetical protein
MSEQSPPSSPGGGRRRSSFTELFIPRPAASQRSQSHSPPNTNLQTPMGNTQPNRRPMSIATLGLSGNTNQSSPLNAFAKQRRASVASSSASGSPEFRNSFEENAVIEEDTHTDVPANTPASPSFARRVSFGAQALRDVRSTGGTSGGRRPSLFAPLQEMPENEPPQKEPSTSSPSATSKSGSRGLFFSHSRHNSFVASIFQHSIPSFDSTFCADYSIGEGFNWSEALRDRTRRQPSISATNNPFQTRPRAASVTTTEPPKEMPKAHSPPVTARLGKPDQLGERMLRGDFMMD